MDINRVIVSGNLTRDPDIKFAASGTQIATFTVAVNKSKDKDGNQPEADFFDCVAFNKTAEILTTYFKKGQKILVEGRIQQDKWKTPEGETRTRVKVVANSIYFMGGKSENTGNGSTEPVSETPKTADDITFFGSDTAATDDDSIPF